MTPEWRETLISWAIMAGALLFIVVIAVVTVLFGSGA
jgi:hypothetical protein